MSRQMDAPQGAENGNAGEPSPFLDGSSGQHRMEVVWRQRAQRLSQRPVPAGAGQDTLPVLVLGVGEESYGICLADVAEVLPPVGITPVPGASAVFAGVINVHGEIRPVMDLRRLLDIQGDGNSDTPRVILLRQGGLEMGLRIDRVEQVHRIDAADLRRAGYGDSESSRFVRGSTRDLLMLLNTEALLAELQTGAST